MRDAYLFVFLFILGLAGLGLSGCAECTQDYDCPGTQICSAEPAECVPFVCRSERDCPAGNTCSANRCLETPTRNAPAAGEPVVLLPAPE